MLALLAVLLLAQPAAAEPEVAEKRIVAVPSPAEVLRKGEQASLLRAGSDVRARFSLEIRDPKGVTRNEQGVLQRVSFGKARRYRRVAVYLDGPQPSSFLVWLDGYGQTDRWVYDQSTDVLVRAPPEDNRAPFLGSDLTWEELTGIPPDRESHGMLEEKRVNGRPCWVIESRRKKPENYHRRITYVDKDTWIVLRIEYYDAIGGFQTLGRNIAVLEALNVVRANAKSPWYATEWKLQHLLNGRSTTMQVSAVEFDSGLAKWALEERFLRRPPPDWVRP